MQFIQQFTFTVELRPGTSPEMQPADCLSRSFETSTISPIVPMGKVKVPEPFWIKHSISIDEFLQAQEADEELEKMIYPWKWIKDRGWRPSFKNGIKYLIDPDGNERIAVPKSLVERLFDYYHYPLHRAHGLMVEEIRAKYIIPKLEDQVRNYLSRCETCVAIKPKKKPKKKSVVTGTPFHPWMSLQIDLIGPLDKTLRGNVYILTIIDCFTRWIEIRALPDRCATSVAEKLLDVFFLRGPPLSIQADNAREFQSEFLTDFLRDLGIASNKICPYHPQSNGMVEAANKRIKTQLQIFDSQGITWDNDLPAIQLALNLQKMTELKTSPFGMLHGWLLTPSSFVSDCFDENQVMKKLKSKGEWSKTIAMKMARAISGHYLTDQHIKTKHSY